MGRKLTTQPKNTAVIGMQTPVETVLETVEETTEETTEIKVVEMVTKPVTGVKKLMPQEDVAVAVDPIFAAFIRDHETENAELQKMYAKNQTFIEKAKAKILRANGIQKRENGISYWNGDLLMVQVPGVPN